MLDIFVLDFYNFSNPSPSSVWNMDFPLLIKKILTLKPNTYMLPLSFVTPKSYIIYQAAKTKTKGSYLSGNPIKFPIYTASTTVIL